MRKGIMEWSMVMLSCVVLSGCVTHRTTQMGQTEVKLEKDDYVMLKPGAMGSSRGFKLAGLIPLWSPSHARAKQKLYESAGVDLAGRSVALANYDSSESTIYLIAFSIPKVTVSADIVEFKDDQPEPQKEAKEVAVVK